MEITDKEEAAGVEKATRMVTTSSGFMTVAMREGWTYVYEHSLNSGNSALMEGLGLLH
jgi:hypothetical protein